MARRSRAREVALQLLFQRDHNSQVDRANLEQFVAARLRDPLLESFCVGLYDGVVARQGEIDERLAAAAENWRLPRMATVDRNVLRLGAYELLYVPDIPPKVANRRPLPTCQRCWPTFDVTAVTRTIQARVHIPRLRSITPPTSQRAQGNSLAARTSVGRMR